MQELFLRYYNEELQYLREMGVEFAHDFPKVAARLGMQDIAVNDPYVERLLEGFAFLTARVRLKQDAQFPRFTKHLLESVYPNFLSQMPAMAVAQFVPNPAESALEEGYIVPRHTTLRSLLGKGEQTRCEFRTAHELRLWPVELADVRYHVSPAALSGAGLKVPAGVRGGISFTFQTLGEQAFNELPLDALTLYLRGSEVIPGLLYKQMIGDQAGLVARSVGARDSDFRAVPGSVAQVGFDDEQSLLPDQGRAFGSYRLWQEYFAFPERFMFVELCGLREAARKCTTSKLEVVVLLRQSEDALVDVLSPENFALHCTPIINLFERRADRIQVSSHQVEHHVLPDRTRPMDFEVWSVTGAKGVAGSKEEGREIYPLYGSREPGQSSADFYYVTHREPRVFSSRHRRQGARTTSYLGSEVAISIVSPRGQALVDPFKQLEVRTLCTNRDLPFHLGFGRGGTDFDLESSVVKEIRCVSRLSEPKQPFADGEATWQLINVLSTNYLALTVEAGAEVLREMLKVFEAQSGTRAARQLDGIVSLQARSVTSRLPVKGPQSFGRGLQVQVMLEESAFEGASAFLFGALLDRFLGRFVTLNSFTQLIVSTQQHGEIMKWPIRAGHRKTL